MQNSSRVLLGLGIYLLNVGPAFASFPIPAPLAGVFGPAGLVVAAVGMAGYATIRHIRR